MVESYRKLEVIETYWYTYGPISSRLGCSFPAKKASGLVKLKKYTYNNNDWLKNDVIFLLCEFKGENIWF